MGAWVTTVFPPAAPLELQVARSPPMPPLTPGQLSAILAASTTPPADDYKLGLLVMAILVMIGMSFALGLCIALLRRCYRVLRDEAHVATRTPKSAPRTANAATIEEDEGVPLIGQGQSRGEQIIVLSKPAVPPIDVLSAPLMILSSRLPTSSSGSEPVSSHPLKSPRVTPLDSYRDNYTYRACDGGVSGTEAPVISASVSGMEARVLSQTPHGKPLAAEDISSQRRQEPSINEAVERPPTTSTSTPPEVHSLSSASTPRAGSAAAVVPQLNIPSTKVPLRHAGPQRPPADPAILEGTEGSRRLSSPAAQAPTPGGEIDGHGGVVSIPVLAEDIEELEGEPAEETQRRIDWIRYYVGQGALREAFELGWNGRLGLTLATRVSPVAATDPERSSPGEEPSSAVALCGGRGPWRGRVPVATSSPIVASDRTAASGGEVFVSAARSRLRKTGRLLTPRRSATPRVIESMGVSELAVKPAAFAGLGSEVAAARDEPPPALSLNPCATPVSAAMGAKIEAELKSTPHQAPEVVLSSSSSPAIASTSPVAAPSSYSSKGSKPDLPTRKVSPYSESKVETSSSPASAAAKSAGGILQQSAAEQVLKAATIPPPVLATAPPTAQPSTHAQTSPVQQEAALLVVHRVRESGGDVDETEARRVLDEHGGHIGKAVNRLKPRTSAADDTPATALQPPPPPPLPPAATASACSRPLGPGDTTSACTPSEVGPTQEALAQDREHLHQRVQGAGLRRLAERIEVDGLEDVSDTTRPTSSRGEEPIDARRYFSETPIELVLKPDGSMPDGAHTDKLGRYQPLSRVGEIDNSDAPSGMVNGRTAYVKEGQPNLLCWWSGDKWWVGKRAELGRPRGFLKVADAHGFMGPPQDGWLVMNAKVKPAAWQSAASLSCVAVALSTREIAATTATVETSSPSIEASSSMICGSGATSSAVPSYSWMGMAEEGSSATRAAVPATTTLAQIFTLSDTDGSGSLTLDELRTAMMAKTRLSDDEIGELFDACDKNGDGTLTMLEAMRGLKALQKEGRLAMLPLEEAGGQSEAMQGGTAIEVQQAVPMAPPVAARRRRRVDDD